MKARWVFSDGGGGGEAGGGGFLAKISQADTWQVK